MTTQPHEPRQAPVIRDQADLDRTWRTLMEPLGFGRHSLWLMLVEADGRALPTLTEVDDLEAAVAGELTDGLARLLGALVPSVAPGGRVAFLLCRPGRDGVRPRDRELASALYAAAAAADVRAEVVHLATDAAVHPLPMDEVLARTPA